MTDISLNNALVDTCVKRCRSIHKRIRDLPAYTDADKEARESALQAIYQCTQYLQDLKGEIP